MIQIISGVYGYREGTRIVPKDPGSPAFSLTQEKEARLVKLGVAKYVKESAAAPANTPPETDPLAYSTDMKLDELKRVALEGYGVDASKAGAKAKVIELIEQAKAKAAEEATDDENDDLDDEGGPDDEGGDNETPPNLTPADPGE